MKKHSTKSLILYVFILFSFVHLHAQHLDSTNARIKSFSYKPLNLHSQFDQSIRNVSSFRNRSYDKNTTVSPLVIQKKQTDWERYTQLNNTYSNLDYENAAKTMYSGKLHIGSKSRPSNVYTQGVYGPPSQKAIPMHLYSRPNNRDGRVPVN